MISGPRAGMVAAVLLAVATAPPAGAIGLSEERALGARFALEARQQLPLLREPALTAYLQRVGGRLVAHLPGQQFTYRFFIVRDATLNAFAVPGGYVYVNAGLLVRVRDENQLAGVLAHELVHVNAHHVVRQQEQTALVNYATLLGLFLSAVHPALGAGAATAGAAVELKYQRQFEQEADHVGLGLMRDAGFDPAGMPGFLRLVQRDQQLNPANVPPYFLSHPLTEDRVAELEHRVRAMGKPAAHADGAELAAAQAILQAVIEPREKVVPPYEELVARAPEDVRAVHLLGLVRLYGGEPERAEPLLARAAAGGAARAQGDHGRALVRLGRVDEARRELEAHLVRYTNDPPIVFELGRLTLAAGDLKAAAALLASALDADPELDEAEYALAECSGKRGDERGQWWHLGRAFMLRGDFERARAAYEKARDLSPKDSPEREEAKRAIEELARATRGFG